ncbi:MAG TPA: aminotransferase DegT [Ruminococcaceae bacterium]|nr:aminotransferase DegT [Oscillospiraceae bacterium]
MQFRDLNAQYRYQKSDIDKAVAGVLSGGRYILGEEVSILEKELAEYVGVKHCVSCANGTDALVMALMALDIKAGDAVFVPNFTFFATAEAVSFIGAVPVFVDVQEATFNLDPEKLEEAIKAVILKGHYNPAAVIAVDLFGLPADYQKISEITRRYSLYLIEDGAQGFGGAINGRRACGFGDISTTSFFPAKPLGCYGDGGALFTDNGAYAEYLKSIRMHGKGGDKYDNVRIGMNSRLDTIQAAILRVKLKYFTRFELDAINKAAARYDNGLKTVAETPFIPEGFFSSWAQYTLRLKNHAQREHMASVLKERGIPTMVYYPKTMSQQLVYHGMEYPGLSVSESLSDRVLSLPMHPYLEESEIDRICSEIKNILNK